MSNKELVDKHKEYLWPCVTNYYEQPIALTRGEGMYVYDAEDNKYLDCFGGVLTTSLGHANPQVNKAVADQIGKISHTSTLYTNEPQANLAEKLAKIAPGKLKQSYFTNSGTEADETAVIAAKLYTGRSEIITLRHSYSGRSTNAMAMAGHGTWKVIPSSVAGVVHHAAPYCYRCPYGLTYPSCELRCAKDVEDLIQTSTQGKIAAFVAEPIMGVGGFITPPKEYFKEIVAIIRNYGGVFICDEVQTGWGRTGEKWFGIEHWDVEPDIMTSAKGMANGAPIGWTIATPEVAAAYPNLTFCTFGGNPVSTAAALATVEFIETENLAQNAKVVGDYLREQLMSLYEIYPIIGDVRGMGLMQGIEVVKDRKTKEPNPQAVLKVFEETKKHGVLIGKGGLHGNVIRLGPPLIATKDHVDELVSALGTAMALASAGN